MSYDKRDYFIDGKRDFSDHSSDDDLETTTSHVTHHHQPQWWVAHLLVSMKQYCESSGVDLLGDASVDSLAALLASRPGKRVYQ